MTLYFHPWPYFWSKRLVILFHCAVNSNKFRRVSSRYNANYPFVLGAPLSWYFGYSRGPNRIPRLSELYSETATGSCSQGCNTNGRPLNDRCYATRHAQVRLYFISALSLLQSLRTTWFAWKKYLDVSALRHMFPDFYSQVSARIQRMREIFCGRKSNNEVNLFHRWWEIRLIAGVYNVAVRR